QSIAVSRRAQTAMPGVCWLRGDLGDADGLPSRVDAIFSCGPLDGFARWYARSTIDCPRVVAFGSTSVEVKRESADAAERDVAARLREGEARSEERRGGTERERRSSASLQRQTNPP